jgi:hypothetical protein
MGRFHRVPFEMNTLEVGRWVLRVRPGMHAVHTLGLFDFDPSQGQGSNGMNGTGSR